MKWKWEGTIEKHMTFEVLTMMTTNINIFWDVTLCSLIAHKKCFWRNVLYPPSRQKRER
jgi:hypothetical protein